MSPKSLLRHPRCVSAIDELSTGNTFKPVIVDETTASKVKHVIMCSGKVYYDLLQKKEDDKRDDVLLVRIEQLYPFPEKEIMAIFSQYKNAQFRWVQEEPLNMGAWDYLLRYLRQSPIDVVARKASASPATGFKKSHDAQQQDILDRAFS